MEWSRAFVEVDLEVVLDRFGTALGGRVDGENVCSNSTVNGENCWTVKYRSKWSILLVVRHESDVGLSFLSARVEKCHCGLCPISTQVILTCAENV